MKTTREAAKEELHNERTKALQDLLEKNYDAEKGYKKAIEDATKPELKKFLREQAVKHNHFATEIDRALHEMNERPREKGSTAGTLQRTWTDLKSLFAKNKDEDILDECQNWERASIRGYEEKLKKTRFTPPIKALLENHVAQLKATEEEIKYLEDLAE